MLTNTVIVIRPIVAPSKPASAPVMVLSFTSLAVKVSR